MVSQAQRPGGVVRHPENRPEGVLEASGRDEAALEEHGFESQRAASVAALATRRHKPGNVEPSDILRHRWATELAAVTVADGTEGPRPGAITDITGALGVGQGVAVSGASCSTLSGRRFWRRWPGSGRWTWPTTTSLIRRQVRIVPLTLFASTFTYRDALAAVARAFDASPRQVARLTRQLLDRDDVLWMIGDGNA